MPQAQLTRTPENTMKNIVKDAAVAEALGNALR
jgi:hypothetical protein